MSPKGRVKGRSGRSLSQEIGRIASHFRGRRHGQAHHEKDTADNRRTKHKGRTTDRTATTWGIDILLRAKVEFVPARQKAARQSAVISLFFISNLNTPNSRHCRDNFNSSGEAQRFPFCARLRHDAGAVKAVNADSLRLGRVLWLPIDIAESRQQPHWVKFVDPSIA